MDPRNIAEHVVDLTIRYSFQVLVALMILSIDCLRYGRRTLVGMFSIVTADLFGRARLFCNLAAGLFFLFPACPSLPIVHLATFSPQTTRGDAREAGGEHPWR